MSQSIRGFPGIVRRDSSAATAANVVGKGVNEGDAGRQRAAMNPHNLLECVRGRPDLVVEKRLLDGRESSCVQFIVSVVLHDRSCL